MSAEAPPSAPQPVPVDERLASATLLRQWNAKPADYRDTVEGLIAALEPLVQAGMIEIEAWKAEFAGGGPLSATERVRRRLPAMTDDYPEHCEQAIWLFRRLVRFLQETDSQRLVRESVNTQERIRELSRTGQQAVEGLRQQIDSHGAELKRAMAGKDLAAIHAQIVAVESAVTKIAKASQGETEDSRPLQRFLRWAGQVLAEVPRTLLAILLSYWIVMELTGQGPIVQLFGKVFFGGLKHEASPIMDKKGAEATAASASAAAPPPVR